MVTAESSQAIVLSAIEHEPDAYLTKPFNRVGLAQRVEKLFQRKTLLKPILQALDRNRPAEVLAACAELCKKDPRLAPLCLRYRADALRNLNRFEELEKFLKAILASRPQPWVYAALGADAQAWPECPAQGVYEQALKAFPIMPGLYDAWPKCWWLRAIPGAHKTCLKKPYASHHCRSVGSRRWASWRWKTKTSRARRRRSAMP